LSIVEEVPISFEPVEERSSVRTTLRRDLSLREFSDTVLFDLSQPFAGLTKPAPVLLWCPLVEAVQLSGAGTVSVEILMSEEAPVRRAIPAG
jgi:hypothetical protein